MSVRSNQLNDRTGRGTSAPVAPTQAPSAHDHFSRPRGRRSSGFNRYVCGVHCWSAKPPTLTFKEDTLLLRFHATCTSHNRYLIAPRMSAPSQLWSPVAEVLDCRFEHLVASSSKAGDGRSHNDVGLHANALELASVGKAYFLTRETHYEVAGQDHICDVTVGAVGRCADERHVSRGG